MREAEFLPSPLGRPPIGVLRPKVQNFTVDVVIGSPRLPLITLRGGNTRKLKKSKGKRKRKERKDTNTPITEALENMELTSSLRIPFSKETIVTSIIENHLRRPP